MNEDDTFERLKRTPKEEMIRIFDHWKQYTLDDNRTFKEVLDSNHWTAKEWNELKVGVGIYDPGDPDSNEYGFRLRYARR